MSIEVNKLRKAFGKTLAVSGVDLNVLDGQMLVLLGPSGCGKTTMMRCIAGLEKPDAGQVIINGKKVFDDREKIDIPVHKRNIGMVFQSYAIWPHMTVFQNVAFPLQIEKVGQREIRQRVNQILSLVGLEGLADKGASYLSGGQMQRVALARSLVMAPTVLLLDEPLSNLDARLRDHLRIELRELQTQLRITSLYVTHDQREALALADQIVVMQDGAIQQTGDPVTVYRHPKTSAVAGFLGYTNIFSAELKEIHFNWCLVGLRETGKLLRAKTAPNGLLGDSTVCVRPEDVKIRAGNEREVVSQDSENTLLGKILSASFMGAHIIYRVKVGGREIWEVLSTELSNKLEIGETVILEIPAANILILPKK